MFNASWLFLNLILVAGALFPVWKGDTPERLAGLVVIANVLIAAVVGLVAPQLQGPIRLANDGLGALALLAITVRYGTPWAGGVMLFFAAQFALYSFYLVMERPADRLKVWVNNADWAGIMLCLILGAIVAWRRRARSRAVAV